MTPDPATSQQMDAPNVAPDPSLDGAALGGSPCSPSVHSLLIEQARKWLAKKGCSVIITDMAHGGPETPDAIGWKGTHATIVECKASRADFHADKNKPFRRVPEQGMGSTRYFCAIAGTLKPEDLPENWGLLEWGGGKLRETVKPQRTAHRANKTEEVRLLLSAIRRIAHTPPKGVSVRCYTFESKCRASLGVANTKMTQMHSEDGVSNPPSA